MSGPGGDEHAAVKQLLGAIDAGDAAAAREYLETLLLALGRERTAGVVRKHDPSPQVPTCPTSTHSSVP